MSERGHKIGFYIKRLIEVRGFSEGEICRRARIAPRRFKMLHTLGAIPTKVEFRRIHMMLRQVPESQHGSLVSIYEPPAPVLADEDGEEKVKICREAVEVKNRVTPRMHEVLHLLRETHADQRKPVELWRADATLATRMTKFELTVREEREIDGRARKFYRLTPLGAGVLRSLGHPA
jgi:hypothetical protein